MLCAEFPYLQYIDLSQIVHVVEAIIIVIRVHWNLSTVFVVSHVLSTKVSPEWRSNQGFVTQKNVPFPWIEVSLPMWTFFRDQILCTLYGFVPWIEVPLYVSF